MFKKARPLKHPDSVEHGYEYAIFLLSLRLRTAGEVRAKMAERGYAAEVIEGVVARLYEHAYLDDRRFAEVFLDNFKRYKHYGYLSIRQKMLLKKLPTQLIEEILNELLDIPEEILIAKRFMNKEFPQYMTQPHSFSYQDKQKIARRLQARGFRGAVISKLIFS